MRGFLIAIVIAAGAAVGAMYLLDTGLQRQADQAFASGVSVRIPAHGNTHNLVGKDWYSAKEHGWDGAAVPTSNSAATLTH
jgi:hypothetical protein